MKVLELIYELEQAYNRFGDIDVVVEARITNTDTYRHYKNIDLIIESEEITIRGLTDKTPE